jgi:hypothetical protein
MIFKITIQIQNISYLCKDIMFIISMNISISVLQDI